MVSCRRLVALATVILPPAVVQAKSDFVKLLEQPWLEQSPLILPFLEQCGSVVWDESLVNDVTQSFSASDPVFPYKNTTKQEHAMSESPAQCLIPINAVRSFYYDSQQSAASSSSHTERRSRLWIKVLMLLLALAAMALLFRDKLAHTIDRLHDAHDPERHWRQRFHHHNRHPNPVPKMGYMRYGSCSSRRDPSPCQPQRQQQVVVFIDDCCLPPAAKHDVPTCQGLQRLRLDYLLRRADYKNTQLENGEEVEERNETSTMVSEETSSEASVIDESMSSESLETVESVVEPNTTIIAVTMESTILDETLDTALQEATEEETPCQCTIASLQRALLETSDLQLAIESVNDTIAVEPQTVTPTEADRFSVEKTVEENETNDQPFTNEKQRRRRRHKSNANKALSPVALDESEDAVAVVTEAPATEAVVSAEPCNSASEIELSAGKKKHVRRGKRGGSKKNNRPKEGVLATSTSNASVVDNDEVVANTPELDLSLPSPEQAVDTKPKPLSSLQRELLKINAAVADENDMVPSVITVEVVTSVQPPAPEPISSPAGKSTSAKCIRQSSLQMTVAEANLEQTKKADSTSTTQDISCKSDETMQAIEPGTQPMARDTLLCTSTTTRAGDFDYDGVDWFFDFFSSPDHVRIGNGFIAASFYDYFGPLTGLKPRAFVEEDDDDDDDSVIPAWMETSGHMQVAFPLAHWSEQSCIQAAKDMLMSLMLGPLSDEDEESENVLPSWMDKSTDGVMIHSLHHWSELSNLLAQ